jgi:hypothetical protein
VPADWTGREIEIRRAGDPWKGTHVAVLARHLPAGVDHSAFFPSLEQGAYELRPIHAHGPHAHEPHGSQIRTAQITGGAVADVVW